MFVDATHMLDMVYRGPLLRIHTPRNQAGADATAPGSCFLDGLPEARPDHDRPIGRWAQIKRIMQCCRDLIVEKGPPRMAPITPDRAIDPARVHCLLRQANVEEFRQIDTLNRHIASLHGSDILLFDRQVADLKSGKFCGRAGRLIDSIKRLQAGADTVAQIYQGKLLGHFVPDLSPYHMLTRGWRVWRGQGRTPKLGGAFLLAWAIPAAVFCYEAYSHLGWGVTGLMLYLAVFGGAAGFQFRCLDDHVWQNSFQDYRALAEGLRVQLFWAAGALSAAVPDFYLRKQVGELGWIQFAMRGPALWAAAIADEIQVPNYEAVQCGWIEDQLDYFRRSAKRFEHAALTGEFWTRSFLILGLLTSALLFLAHVAWSDAATAHNVVARALHDIRCHEGVVGVIMITLPAIAAAFTVSRELRFYEAHAHSYALMERIFKRAADEIEDLKGIGDTGLRHTRFKYLIRELGREALVENAEWLVAHRYRPIEHGQ